MGCAPSLLDDQDGQGNAEKNKMEEFALDLSSPEEVLASYIGLDREIGRLENASPAPRFGRAIACLKQLNTLLAVFQNASSHRTDDEFREEEDVQKLFIELGLHKSTKIASEHEEFIANVNRDALDKNRTKIVKKLIEEVEQELEQSSAKVNYLQKLYQHQEALLMNIFGASYGSEQEKRLEQETDTMHNFRDTLAIGVLQWEHGQNYLKAAASFAHRGIISWNSLNKQNIERKLSLAVEARNNLQEAAFLVHRVQDTLPGVQLPYCSQRELRAILQAIEYLFTDILIQQRYAHALQLYENFHERIQFLEQWIVKTVNSSLRRDLKEFDLKLAEISRKLRDERIHQICLKLKIPNNYAEALDANPSEEVRDTSMYQTPMKPVSRYTKETRYKDVLTPAIRDGSTDLTPPDYVFTDPNLQREFQRKLDARQSAMWPSRRMEELRQLTISD